MPMKWTFKARKDGLVIQVGQPDDAARDLAKRRGFLVDHAIWITVYASGDRAEHHEPVRDFARHPRAELLGSPGIVGADAHAAGDHGAGESRRHFRSAHKLRWPIELSPVSSPPARDARVRAETLGVSLGGTFVVCDPAFPVDTDLHLWLYPPDPLPRGPRVLRLLGRVRWVNASPGELPRGFGLAFRALTAADEVALHGSFARSSKVL
jgi:hypothetical protein